MKKTRLNKIGKQSVSRLRNKCDALLTPIVKKLHPKCESCMQPTQVAHHWIEKSRSNFLRYDLRNLVGLCHSCHSKLHNAFGNSFMNTLDVGSTIIARRGQDWHLEMRRLATMTQKVNVAYYKEQLERLQKLSTPTP